MFSIDEGVFRNFTFQSMSFHLIKGDDQKITFHGKQKLYFRFMINFMVNYGFLADSVSYRGKLSLHISRPKNVSLAPLIRKYPGKY